jgi:para-nitrobenzyl esterase
MRTSLVCHPRWVVLVVAWLVGCGSDSGMNPVMPGNDLVVTLPDGQVQGDLVGSAGNVRLFLKIPFAKPPVGDLRWKAPVKNDAWSSVRHETSFAVPCPQLANTQNGGSTTEDCLYLNVWTPEPAPVNAAVMVWIHGGGNLTGSAGDRVPVPGGAGNPPLWYDGQVFAARHGVVVVSMNYRLGVMGFFPDAALAAEGSPVGNQGLLDQRLSLQWVHDNIARFGGDPGNVTIFGESAGSLDVCLHIASPGSRGLFHRVIGESGGCTGQLAPGGDMTAQVTTFAQQLGCDTAANPLACLRGKAVGDVLNAAAGVFRSPFVDGPGGFLPDRARVLFDAGNIAKVPYLAGSNNDEGRLFTYMQISSITMQTQYTTALNNQFGATLGPMVGTEYPATDYPGAPGETNFYEAFTDAFGDSGLICGTHDSARRAVAAGIANVYMYNFNVPWSLIPGTTEGVLRASHASEIDLVFDDGWNFDATRQAVSDAMNAYWAQFAKTGDPNFPGAPAVWPKFAPDAQDHDQRLQLEASIHVVNDFKREKCTFWRGFYH